jgi:hypothetical protein
MYFHQGDIISHSELKKFPREFVVVPFVSNPKECNNTHGFMNGNFTENVSGVCQVSNICLLTLMHTIIHQHLRPPFFKEIVSGVFDVENKPVLVLHCLSGILHLSYEMVTVITGDGYIESKHQTAEAGRLEALFKEGWSILCAYAQQELHKQLHHVSSYNIGAGLMCHTASFNLLKYQRDWNADCRVFLVIREAIQIMRSLHVQSIFLELYAGWVGNQKNQNKNNEKRK